MLQFIVIFLFFMVSLLVMWVALRFSKFKGESEEPCENPEECVLRKIGLSKLHCDS
ncbi:hypothetical protein MNBD_IGNAVI01-221 [hydrothermal vent metagenome]|uniref:Uncharacterized protein n=1 Tax=hydrothermal vent metagenome TaxID=652676 RepID=A0A3B1CHW6_9ZZZZ